MMRFANYYIAIFCNELVILTNHACEYKKSPQIAIWVKRLLLKRFQ